MLRVAEDHQVFLRSNKITAPFSFYYDEFKEDASILIAFDSDDNTFLPVVCT
jgi:hypothetical protein